MSIKFRVKEEPPHIDDALLVAKVKQNQFLFDVKDSDYRNLPQRAEVWKNIATELNIDNRKQSFMNPTTLSNVLFIF